jgi:hypothetical protein
MSGHGGGGHGGGGHGGHKPPHGGNGHGKTAHNGGHHNNAAVAYVGAAIGCSAVWLVAEGAYTAATEHRDLTYAEAYSTAGGCFLPIIGSYLGYELGKQADICVANQTCPGMANNPYR